MLTLLNFWDLFFFLILDLGNDYVDAIPVGYRILDGLFQVDVQVRGALTTGHCNTNNRGGDRQLAIDQSGAVGQLPCHDVHLSVSPGNEHS